MKRSIQTAGCLLLIAATAGCSSTQEQTASMGMTAEQPPLLTLGAGDSLGWAVFTNDVILASRQPGPIQHVAAPNTD